MISQCGQRMCNNVPQAAAQHWGRSQRREREEDAGGGTGMLSGCFQGLRSRGASATMPFACPVRFGAEGVTPCRIARFEKAMETNTSSEDL